MVVSKKANMHQECQVNGITPYNKDRQSINITCFVTAKSRDIDLY